MTTFTEGQRVFHRQRKQFGTYVRPGWVDTESIVRFRRESYIPGFGNKEELRVTTAQLVAADEVERSG